MDELEPLVGLLEPGAAVVLELPHDPALRRGEHHQQRQAHQPRRAQHVDHQAQRAKELQRDDPEEVELRDDQAEAVAVAAHHVASFRRTKTDCAIHKYFLLMGVPGVAMCVRPRCCPHGVSDLALTWVLCRI